MHHISGAMDFMPVELNFEIILILAILGVTIFLFVTELFRIDFTAIIVMVSLGIINQFPNIDLFPDPSDLFAGFSSNAVLSIIAVMIIGAGLDKTGLMSKVAAVILKMSPMLLLLPPNVTSMSDSDPVTTGISSCIPSDDLDITSPLLKSPLTLDSLNTLVRIPLSNFVDIVSTKAFACVVAPIISMPSNDFRLS